VSAGNTPPRATIDAPAASTTWAVGQEITFAGGGGGAEEGALSAASLRWSLILHHCATATECHTHPVEELSGVAAGSFAAPDHGYPAFLELRLTATDAGGLSDTASVRLEARPVDLALVSSPAGLTLSAGDTVAAAPFVHTAVARGATTITAPSPQTVSGRTYEFVSWSDGGAQTHVVAPDQDATVTAAYREVQATTVAADGFGRSVVNGWGTAPVGGAWSLAGAASDFDVNGAQATIALPAAGTSRGALLPAVSARDVDTTVSIRSAKIATGSGQYVYAVHRHQPAGAEYRTVTKLLPSGAVQVYASRLAGTAETTIGSAVTVTGLTRTPATTLLVRAQVTGANPTTIRITAWPAGSAEPTAWTLTTSDATASLQTAGNVGLRAYTAATTTNAPILITLDDYRVRSP
jgi:hypothetical protein